MWEVVGIRLRISTPSTPLRRARAASSDFIPLSISCSRRRKRRRPGPLLIANTPGLLDRGVHEERHTLRYAAIRARCPVPRRPGSRWSRTATGYSCVNAAGSRSRSAGDVITETCIARPIARGFSAGSRCGGPGPATSRPGAEPGFMPPASSPGGAGRPRK